VALQERTVTEFLRVLRASPAWADKVVVFLSEDGEQFREHGGLYHNHSLFDEELRVPGWLIAGPRALDATQRTAIGTHAGRRTYMQDVHETVVDLFGVEGARATLPFADLVTGRPLLRPRSPGPGPTVLLATPPSVGGPAGPLRPGARGGGPGGGALRSRCRRARAGRCARLPRVLRHPARPAGAV